METNLKNRFNVIIDTNVIIASLLTSHEDSATAKVMDLFYNDKINVYYSDDIYKEYEDVINRPKFNFDKDKIEAILLYIKQNAIKFNPEAIEAEMIDIKDKPFYEIVLDERIKDSKLITGNIKHFPSNPKIITPIEFLEEYTKILIC